MASKQEWVSWLATMILVSRPMGLVARVALVGLKIKFGLDAGWDFKMQQRLDR